MKKIISFLCALTLCIGFVCGTALAACSHSWSNWKQVGMYHEGSSSITGCEVLVEEFERTCTKCGTIDAKKVRTELPHAWERINGTTYRCTRCGATKSLAR